MKFYCVEQKKETDCFPGSEQYVQAKNGRTMMKCICNECGITKTKFVKSIKTGGGAPKDNISCGYNQKGKKPGSMEDCFKK